MPDSINLLMKIDKITEQWQPRVVAEMNDYQFKVVRIEGDFIWHSHPEPTRRSSSLRGSSGSTSATAR